MEDNHVGISLERDTPLQSTTHGPGPGSAASWRNTPRSAVTWQVLGWITLGAALLVCLGLLLGAIWTTRALQPSLRQQAEERRKRDEEWAAAVRAARREQDRCPRCAYPLSDRDS
jgi:hypothetical protein